MTRTEILTVLKANLSKIVEAARGKEIDEAQSMKDYGADSLEVVEVASRTMKELKLRVPRTELSKAKTIGEFVDLLEKSIPIAAAS